MTAAAVRPAQPGVESVSAREKLVQAAKGLPYSARTLKMNLNHFADDARQQLRSDGYDVHQGAAQRSFAAQQAQRGPVAAGAGQRLKGGSR